LGIVVLDTSVIVKSLVRPSPNLLNKVYRREVETHEKCRDVILEIERLRLETLIPFAGLVEVASVLNRLLNEDFARRIVSSLSVTYKIVREDEFGDYALEVAFREAPSGFDTYFIALARKEGSTLITDDEPMAIHAERLKIDSISVRSLTKEEILKRLRKLSEQP